MKEKVKKTGRMQILPARLKTRSLEQQLKDFPRAHRKAVQHVAARHPFLRDLAASYPALLFKCAVPHAGVDRHDLQQRVIAGQPLKELAVFAGLPMWTRALPPHGLCGPVPVLPAGAFASRQIANLLPKEKRYWPSWISMIGSAHAWSGEAFAIWVARRWLQLRKERKPEMVLKSLALWAWYSGHPETAAGKLVLRRWTPDISFRHADEAKDSWLDSIRLYLELGEGKLFYPRATTRYFDGHEFVCLDSAAQIIETFRTAKNCIRGYGCSLAERQRRLVSVQKDGVLVAVVCLSDGSGQRHTAIEELRAPRNGDVSLQTAQAVRRWFLAQDPHLFDTDMGPFLDPFSQKTWLAFWKPYWLAKGRQPWFPFRGTEHLINDLRW